MSGWFGSWFGSWFGRGWFEGPADDETPSPATVVPADVAALLREPGRLCLNPTDLDLPFPHGGVSLPTRGIEARPSALTEELLEEPFGREVVEALELGESWEIRAELRAPSPEVLDLFLGGAVTGGGTGEDVLEDLDGGRRASDRAAAVLFSPRDVLSGWFVLFPRALLSLGPRAHSSRSAQRGAGIAVRFQATRAASARP